MNSQKGIFIYIIVFTFIALLFFPETKFSTTFYRMFESIGTFLNGMMKPTEASLFKLAFFCCILIVIAKVFAGQKQ